MAVYCGPAIAEFFTLGPKATIAVGVLTAVLGMDILGGLMAAAKAGDGWFKVDFSCGVALSPTRYLTGPGATQALCLVLRA